MGAFEEKKDAWHPEDAAIDPGGSALGKGVRCPLPDSETIAPALPRTAGRTSSLRGNLALLAGSIAVSLALGEMVARAFLPPPLPWLYPQVAYRADPTLIFALKPNQVAFTADKPVSINERGLRGRPLPYERDSKKKRLLFLGDSIVFGYGVREAEGVTARVESRLEEMGIHSEVINSGVPAYNTEQEVAFLETEGVRYKPDWVIVGVCWNDINRKSGVMVSPEGWLGETAGGERSFVLQWQESPSGYAVRDVLKRSRLLYGFMSAWRALLVQMSAPDDYARFEDDVLRGRETERVADGWAQFGAALHRLEELSRRDGFRVLVATFPIPQALERPYPRSSYPARVQQLASREHLGFLDLAKAFEPSFRGHESLFIAYDADHPNAVGHDLAARAVVDSILQQEGRADAKAP